MQDDCTTNSHYPQLYSSLYKVGRMQFLSLGVKGFISQIWGKSFSRWGFHKSLAPRVWGRGLHAVPFFSLSNWETGASETTTACETGVSEGWWPRGEWGRERGWWLAPVQSLNYCGRDCVQSSMDEEPCSINPLQNTGSYRVFAILVLSFDTLASQRRGLEDTRSSELLPRVVASQRIGSTTLIFFHVFFFCKTSRIYTLKKTSLIIAKAAKFKITALANAFFETTSSQHSPSRSLWYSVLRAPCAMWKMFRSQMEESLQASTFWKIRNRTGQCRTRDAFRSVVFWLPKTTFTNTRPKLDPNAQSVPGSKTGKPQKRGEGAWVRAPTGGIGKK